MMELTVNNLVKYLDATQVFDGITFQIYDGEKVGIVGINGCGKSTLLKVIAGIHEITSHDKGGVFVPRGASVGYLEQVMPDKSGKKVIDVLHEAFEEVAQIESELRSMEEKMKSIKGEELERVFRNYSILQEKYETKGGYDREEKLSKVCIGLNINDSFLNRDFNLLSGGEKTTVMLGKILLQSPDILLLDEPTNHLDMKSVEWLEGYLKSYKGMVLIVSHDRYFLDNVVGKIIEIEDMQNKVYKGNYSSYVKQREENMIKQFEDFKEQQKKIKAMENAIKKLRDWAVRADNEKFFKRAASMQKALDKIERIDKPKFEHDNMKLNFKETGRSGKDVIKVKDLCKSFDDKELFKDAEMMIYFQERAALIGSNGCGKTTFLKMLLGEDEDFTGELKLGESVKAAYLPQNITFTDEEATVLEDFREDFEILEGKAREYLAKFMFYGGTVFRKVKHLSGGERIRLKLSKLLYNDINLLILDEPTNHLDIESIENLETALENFKGTIFFISHDRYFINKVGSRIIEIKDGKFNSYAGNYDDFKQEKEKLKIKEVPEVKAKKAKIKKERTVDEGKKLQKIIEKLEREISELEEKIAAVEKEMESYSCEYSKLSELADIKNGYEKELEDIMNLWDEKSRELEEVI